MRIISILLMVFFVSNILFAHEFSGNELNRELAVFFENAEENVKRGQDASAIKNYSIVIEELPDFVKAYINRGNAYFRLGVKVNDPKKYQLAINDYSKVIELDPLFVTAYRLRSRALSHLGKEKEAEIDKLHYYFNQNLVRNADGIKMNALLEKVNKSISDNPDKAKGYLDRGNIYIKFKRWELAWVDLNKAIDLDPKNWQSYFDRATVYMAKKIYNQTTIDDLNKAQELASADKEVVWECLMRKANVHSKGKRIEESIANYTKAIELNPKSWFAYYERSFVYGNKEMLAESMNDFSQVIALNPMHSKVYLYRGALYKMLGKLEESKADLKKYKFLENQ